MAEENEDLEKEGIEITGSAKVNLDADGDLPLGAPLVDEDGMPVDDEQEMSKLDLPEYVDEDKGLL